ncbi:FG-GAP-like repeat-containing protein [Streptomyces sp. NPDC088801]|uniref:FG-GAP-like repeat-containing protein n=1 Tax=Streptomyces sp. NPDC088801 TaxID=3365903 RepID=UPI00382254F1
MTHPRSRAKLTAWTAGVLAAGLAAGLLSASTAQSVNGDQVPEGTDDFTVKVHVSSSPEIERACSGTLVDQQWVLTAASCFSSVPLPQTTVAHVTLDGKSPPLSARLKQRVRELVPHPTRDLLMARVDDLTTPQNPLDGPFPENSAARVATTAPAQGDQLRVVGFGRTKQEWVPDRAHTGSFGVDSVQPTTLEVSPRSAGAALCKGDAGAPVLSSAGRVVGVVTAAWGGGCLNSEETRTSAVATRVDDIADWVQQVRLTSRKAHITDVMTSADFNGDGRTDIASLMADDSVQVFYGRPDGTLEYGRPLSALGRGTHKQIIAGDFDAASGPEVIGVDGMDGDLRLGKRSSLLPGREIWRYEALWKDATWKNGLPAAALGTGAVGRDTLLFQWPDGSLYTYKRDAGGKLVDQKKSMWSDKTWKRKRIATADFNGDGRDDIAAVATDGALHLYPGKSDGTFDKARSMWPDKSWTTTRPVLGGDFNGDGKADLAAVQANGDVRWFAGDGKGALAAGKSMWPKV